ncbi:MAG: tetratricopeptide repeat protein [Treponema sp.]|nr:tetratricopeptide repeat protein [Treponema sp.]
MRKGVYAVIFAAFAVIFPFTVSAEDKVLAAANRKTAVRFLKAAENSLIEKNWNAAYSQAQMGIAYDDSVADLWYIEAVAQNGLGNPRAEILPLVTKAITKNQWVDYNRDGARILYADLLCDTGQYEQSVSILDAVPLIYSADAEYIRIKAYYRMNTADSVSKARSRVNGARKIYSGDTRFPRLFFRYEYALKNADISPEVQAVADSFIAKMPEYDNPDAELEIYAALFASGARQKRMLQAFAAHNMEHVLYAGAALTAGLMTQAQALACFCRFADKTVSLSLLRSFVPLITDEKVKTALDEYLTAYSGVLTIDTDGDLEPNLIVQYKRGRPQSLTWDSNNDGIKEWTAQCDFGVPVSVSLPVDGITLYYGTYPAVVKAVFAGGNGAETFMIADETYNWSPFSMTEPEEFKNTLKGDFFVPEVRGRMPVNKSDLFNAASSYEVPSPEREKGTILFTMQNGHPQTADYYAGGKMYAHAVFNNSLPVMRSVDNDGDGIFETTETFGYDPDNTMHRTASDSSQITADLFGLSPASGIYIKMIQIDVDGDTIPDFTEEYLADGGKITSWDNDADGRWDVRFERFPRKEGEPLAESTSFYVPPERKLVIITSYNGEPVKVSSGNFNYDVIEGTDSGLYWIGKQGTPEDEKKALEMLNQTSGQGVSLLVESGSERLLAVRVGDKSYVQILPDRTEIPHDSDAIKNESDN